MSRNKAWLVASILVGLIPVAVYLLLYPRMPATVPIHYDGGGTADRFVSKSSFELPLLAALGEVGLLFMLVLRRMLRGLARTEEAAPQIRAAVWNVAIAAVTLLFSGIGISALAGMV